MAAKHRDELLQALRAHKAELLALLASGPQDAGLVTAAPSVTAGGPQPLGADGPQDHPHGDAGQALRPQAPPRPRSAVPVAVEWPAAAADFCLLLTVDDLPPVPFRLNAWTEVRDAGKMLRWLRADVLRGPSGPRAFYGALQRDLQDLQRFALRAAENRPQDAPESTRTGRRD
jgi:hypothetical protein